MSRVVPVVGMAVRVCHLGATEDAEVEAVEDGGRTVVAAGQRFTLRPLNGHFIRDSEPSYGTRLMLEPG